MNILYIEYTKKETYKKLRLFDDYKWHQHVWKLHGSSSKRTFLFRVIENEYNVNLMILSSEKLTFDQSIGKEVLNIKIDEKFLCKEKYSFNLKVNPTKKVKGKRISLINKEEVQQWLKRKAEESGFNITSCRLDEEIWKSCIKNRQEKYKSFVFLGELKITDKEKFIKAFTNGIGTKKSFGYGLLLLK